MAIHPITAAMWLLTFLALGSAGLLYYSFRKHLDDSARYMLIGQLFIAFSAGLFALSDSLRLNLGPLHLLVINATVIVAELTILFGLLALNRDVPKHWFRLAFLATIAWAALIETLRPVVDLKTLQIANSLVAALMASITLYLCLRLTSDRFRHNLFVRVILISQVGVISFWVTRAALVASDISISVLAPTQLSTILIIGYISFLLFRALAYLGIRVSWAMQDYRDASRLNAELVNTMRERDRFFKRLISSNKAIGLGAFAASIAHQLNQPLTALNMQAHVVKRQVDDPNCDRSQAKAASDAIVDLSKKLAELVRSLHGLFSNDPGPRETIRLSELASEVQQFFSPILAEQRIKLTLTCRADALVQVNHSQVQQVILNVINNAAAACLASKNLDHRIDMVIDQQDPMALIRISDNGPGFNETALEQAFELFDSDNPEGMGFGLWLSRTIMVQHGGDIELTNRADGGTTVTISFPVSQSLQ